MDYNFTINNKEDFVKAKTKLINDFIQQIIGAEVTTDWRSPYAGRIISCMNPDNKFESLVYTVYFEDSNMMKGIKASDALFGRLLFVDDAMMDLYNSYRELYSQLMK
jgi:hypothetical protein